MATALFTGAEVLTLWTAIPKLPDAEVEHPAGADAEGAIEAVTACGIATGLA